MCRKLAATKNNFASVKSRSIHVGFFTTVTTSMGTAACEDKDEMATKTATSGMEI
jgi:hypothetical protein